MWLVAIALSSTALLLPQQSAPAVSSDVAPRPAAIQAPPRSAAAPKAMSRRQRMEFIFSQLGLTEEQRQQAEALLLSVTGGTLDGEISLEQVRNLYIELQQATQDGDQAAMERLAAELRRVGNVGSGNLPSDIRDDAEFLQAFRSMLDRLQQEKLDRLVAWLTHNPAGQLRPVDLFDLARELGLSEGQLKQMSQVEAEMRRKANESPANDDRGRVSLTKATTAAIHDVLTPEQRELFQAKVERLTGGAPAR